MQNELKHYGVLGMKWGVRRRDRVRARERDALIKDAKRVERNRMPNGEQSRVYGTYGRTSGFGPNMRFQPSVHIVDKHGKVKLSYFEGEYGAHYLAAGKSYVDKNIDLNKYFKNVEDISIEYDVYK